jgi:hypothetical protein
MSFQHLSGSRPCGHYGAEKNLSPCQKVNRDSSRHPDYSLVSILTELSQHQSIYYTVLNVQWPSVAVVTYPVQPDKPWDYLCTCDQQPLIKQSNPWDESIHAHWRLFKMRCQIGVTMFIQIYICKRCNHGLHKY